MVLFSPAEKHVRLSRGVFAVLLSLLATGIASAAGEFPFDRELMLDTARMGRVKRVPMLIVAPNGQALIQLWCKDVLARVEVSNGTIKIEPGPVPDALPAMMSTGQCSPERMQADGDTLAALAQMGEWKLQNGGVVLSGAATLKFRPSDH